MPTPYSTPVLYVFRRGKRTYLVSRISTLGAHPLLESYSPAAVSVCLTSGALLILEHYGLPCSASNRCSVHGYRYEDVTLARLVHFSVSICAFTDLAMYRGGVRKSVHSTSYWPFTARGLEKEVIIIAQRSAVD